MKMKQKDFFKVLINKGNLEESGLSSEGLSYRIIEYNGQRFKITLKEEVE